jgi:hypothetical protein
VSRDAGTENLKPEPSTLRIEIFFLSSRSIRKRVQLLFIVHWNQFIIIYVMRSSTDTPKPSSGVYSSPSRSELIDRGDNASGGNGKKRRNGNGGNGNANNGQGEDCVIEFKKRVTQDLVADGKKDVIKFVKSRIKFVLNGNGCSELNFLPEDGMTSSDLEWLFDVLKVDKEKEKQKEKSKGLPSSTTTTVTRTKKNNTLEKLHICKFVLSSLFICFHLLPSTVGLCFVRSPLPLPLPPIYSPPLFFSSPLLFLLCFPPRFSSIDR